jgi:hypothetical protein
MKITKSHIFFNLLAIAIFLCVTSCKKENLSNSLSFICSGGLELNNFKNIKEPNGNFEIKIPANWKKEFFISERESRLYFADTTKELNQSYITDIGLYQNKKVINGLFFKEKLDSIKNESHLELTSSTKISFQEKPGYILHTTQNYKNTEKNTFEIYLQNKNRSYYLIKVDIYGKENQATRFCNALSLIEKGKFY